MGEKIMEEYIRNEIKFLQELDAETNEHGVYIYESKNKIHSINLPYILRQYRDWLIDHKIVKEK